MNNNNIGNTSFQKNIGQVIAGLTLIISLIASWSHFYSEQKINTFYRKSQEQTIRKHEKEIIRLNENQSTLFLTVSNNTKNNDELKQTLLEVNKLMQNNQIYLTKIASKVGVE